MGGLDQRYLELRCSVGVRREPRGDFPLSSKVVKTKIPTYRNSLVVEKCWEYGINFGASKLEKTLFGFSWAFDKDLISKFAKFSGKI